MDIPTFILINSSNWFFHLVIALPVLLLLIWTTNKFLSNKRLKVGVAILGTVIITPLLYIFLVYFYFWILFGNDTKPDQDFDSIAWGQVVDERYTMAEDLLEGQKLMGLQKQEVILLLGHPIDDTLAIDTLSKWSYSMGVHPYGLGIKGNYLELYFQNSHVDSVAHTFWVD